MDGRKINLQEQPDNITGKPQAKFVGTDFDALVWDKAYDVYHDKMITCPCKNDKTGSFLSNCKNCRGSGWILVERIETKMVLQSINLETKMKQWSEEKIGTVRITAQKDAELAHMDRVIVLDGRTIYNQVLYPKIFKGKLFAFLTYEPIQVAYIYLHKGIDAKPQKLIEGTDYTIEDGLFFLNDSYKTPSPQQQEIYQISIRYSHQPQFHIIDMVREQTISDSLEGTFIEENRAFPVSAIARRSHYVLDKQNYDKDLILDNTEEES